MTTGVASLKWDWYQGTVYEDSAALYPEKFIDDFAQELGATSVDLGSGRYGYESCSTLRDSDGSALARVLWGGRNRWVNVTGSGMASGPVADLLRSKYSHQVTRVDIAHDVQAPDAFDRLLAECLSVADSRGVSVSQAGDWLRAEKGRTLYLGSRKSELFCRLYEKGLEQRAKAPNSEAAAVVPSDWVRLELSVKPQKRPRRLLAAQSEPSDFWGWSIWSKTLCDAVLALDVPRIERMSWQRSDDAVALDWLARQYGQLLTRVWGRVGSWENVGVLLGGLIEGGKND